MDCSDTYYQSDLVVVYGYSNKIKNYLSFDEFAI